MPEPEANHSRPTASGDSNRARDHLANERTFLAWVRTGIALVVFGFAIGRFAIAIRQLIQIQGRRASATVGLSVWFGMIAIVGGVLLTLAGLLRYRQTRDQLESGAFKPAGSIITQVGVLVAMFGLALGGYLVYIELRL